MKLKFVWIGKLKRSFWRDAADLYWKRIGKRYTLEEICLKDGPGKLSPSARATHEAEAILGKVTPQDLLICLDEKGKNWTSRELAASLRTWLEDPGRTPCFVIGGAYGLGRELKVRAHTMLSLGRLTLPHELARVVLLEQIYRADTILRGLPYHH